MKSNKKLIAIIVIIAVIIVGVAAFFIIKGVLEHNENASDDSYISNYDPDTANGDKIFNVVYLGIDEQENRSDVMMVLSFNKTKNTVNVISLLRDTSVMIEGCSVGTKLGFAYKWGCMDNGGVTGGSKKAIDTINDNFGTHLKNYITMEFADVVDIVDAVGGVNVTLTQAEADVINAGGDCDPVVEGDNLLNGTQALTYSRQRKVSEEETDGSRAVRQQKVLKSLFAKVQQMTSSELTTFVDRLEDDMTTNLFMEDFSDLMNDMDAGTATLNEYIIPDADYESNVVGDWVDTPADYTCEYMDLDPQVWLWTCDIDEAGTRLRSLIGEE